MELSGSGPIAAFIWSSLQSSMPVPTSYLLRKLTVTVVKGPFGTRFASCPQCWSGVGSSFVQLKIYQRLRGDFTLFEPSEAIFARWCAQAWMEVSPSSWFAPCTVTLFHQKHSWANVMASRLTTHWYSSCRFGSTSEPNRSLSLLGVDLDPSTVLGWGAPL